MGSNAGTKQQQHNSSVNHSLGESKGGLENGPHHQSSTFSSSIENSCHERKKRPSGSTLSSSTCNQLVTSGSLGPGLLTTTTTSRNTSPSSQSSQSSNSSSSWNGNNQINVTSPTPSSLNKRSSNFQDGGERNRLNQIGIKNTIASHSNQFNSSPSYERQSKKAGDIRLLSPSNCNSLERSESWNSRQQHEVCGGGVGGSNSGSLSSLLNPITRKQLQDPFYRPFVS